MFAERGSTANALAVAGTDAEIAPTSRFSACRPGKSGNFPGESNTRQQLTIQEDQIEAALESGHQPLRRRKQTIRDAMHENPAKANDPAPFAAIAPTSRSSARRPPPHSRIAGRLREGLRGGDQVRPAATSTEHRRGPEPEKRIRRSPDLPYCAVLRRAASRLRLLHPASGPGSQDRK